MYDTHAVEDVELGVVSIFSLCSAWITFGSLEKSCGGCFADYVSECAGGGG